MEAIRFNLIPPATRHARRRRHHVLRWMAAIVAAALLDCIPLASQWWSRREAERLGGQLTSLMSEIRTLRDDTKRLNSAAAELHAQIERAKALRSKRAWSGMLSLVANALPRPCWLTTFATEPEAPEGAAPQRKEPPPNPASTGEGGKSGEPVAQIVVIEAPRRLKLSGMAREATQPLVFVSALRETGVFKSVALERSLRGSGSDSEVFQFELVCEW